jgi:hypothetical protein
MDEIKFPAICIVDNRIEVFDGADIEITCTLLSYERGTVKNIQIYDSDGGFFKSTEAVPCRKISFFERIFCHVWTPFIRVKLKFSKVNETTDIAKLRSSVARIIRMDDDIYCQFIEKGTALNMINSSQSVIELIASVRKILEGEPAEESAK